VVTQPAAEDFVREVQEREVAVAPGGAPLPRSYRDQSRRLRSGRCGRYLVRIVLLVTVGSKRSLPASSLAFTISLLAATFVQDSGHLLQKGHLSMAKAIAGDAKPGTATEKTTAPARDPKLAVEEEYQMARRLNTVQSLELFIARHPDDPLAARARADLRLLQR
jgi:hypothetical protein